MDAFFVVTANAGVRRRSHHRATARSSHVVGSDEVGR